MKFLALLSLALIASAKAFPFENAENVALDTAHEAHDGIVPAAEKPLESDLLSSDLAKTTEGVLAAEPAELPQPASEVILKVEQNAEPDVVAPTPEPVAVLAEDPVESKAVVALVAEPESVVQEPEVAVIAIVEDPVKVDEDAAERAARAYGYPFNNYAGYGAWANNRRSWESYGNGYGFIPNNYQYPEAYAAAHYLSPNLY